MFVMVEILVHITCSVNCCLLNLLHAPIWLQWNSFTASCEDKNDFIHTLQIPTMLAPIIPTNFISLK